MLRADYTTSTLNDCLNINSIGNESNREIPYTYGQTFVDADHHTRM